MTALSKGPVTGNGVNRFGWLILLHAALIPLFLEMPGLPFRLTSTDFLAGAVLILWAASRRQSGYRSLRDVPALGPSLALVASHWLSVAVAQDFAAALKEAVKLSSIMAFYVAVADWIPRQNDRWRIAWALIFGATVVSLIAVVDSIGKPLGRGFGEHRAAGTLGHANALGAYLAALVPLAAGLLWAELQVRHRRSAAIFLSAAIAVMGIALFLTLSRAAWLSLGIAALATLGFNQYVKREHAARRWLLLAGRAAIVAVVASTLFLGAWTIHRGALPGLALGERLANVNSFGDRERVALLQAAWGMFQEHWFLGVGPGNFQTHVREYTTFAPAWRQEFPHNVILHMAAETGIVGLLAFLWWTLAVLLAITNGVKNNTASSTASPGTALALGAGAGVLSAMLGSLFGYPFVHGTWEPLTYCLALALPVSDCQRLEDANLGMVTADRNRNPWL